MNTKTLGRKIAKVVAFALMAVTVFVGGLATSKILQIEETAQVGNVQTDNSLQAQQTINNGISLMAADGSGYVGNTLGQSVPYGALKVTATVSPATAKNQTLSWSCAWAGTTSSWSSGKTVEDYFSLSTSGANAHEVYLWAKQPFGDQITVTATSTDGGNKSATMTVDFARRMTGVTGITGFAGSFDYNSGIFYNELSKASHYVEGIERTSYTPTYSVGTKNLTWTLREYLVCYDSDLDSALASSFGLPTNGEWSCGTCENEYDVLIFNNWEDVDRAALFDGSNGVENYNTLKNLISANDSYIGDLYFYFESAETDSFGNKYTYQMKFGIYVSAEYLGMSVENVTLSDRSLTI